MNQKYKNYNRRKFTEWKAKVKKHLPLFVVYFYTNCNHFDYEWHRLLGRVVKDINDPFYTIIDEQWNHINEESEMCLQIALKLNVNRLFSKIKSR